jgi:2',3'-cyclic-nucleotide 2'-phosphodiesterase (5'-nucleotidase family)
MNKRVILGLLLGGSAVFTSCTSDDNPASSVESQKSIVILFESDSHCEVSGYPKIAGLRDAINQSDTARAGVVCCGDFLQGGPIGAVSKGKYITDIMKAVGYDVVTVGNHEFEFGGANMENLLNQLGAPVVCANLFRHGESNPIFPAYTIRQYGDKRVAFIGILTPETIETQRFAFFDSDGKQLYDLTGNGLTELLQQTVDKIRAEGADYVVALSHVGEKSDIAQTSYDLIKGTRGIDVVLDGHTHTPVPSAYVNNLDGKAVLVAQSGNKFKNIGKLVIKSNGALSAILLKTEEVAEESKSVSEVIETVNAEVKSMTSKVICHSDYPLLSLGDGDTLSAFQETAIGDLVTDAYRNHYQTDIGLQHGKSLTKDIAAGDITMQDMFNLMPFEDQLYLIEVKGDLLLKTLAKCTESLPSFAQYFPQCSGLKYTIHTKSDTVTDVMVLDRASGEYKPLDLEKDYQVALGVLYSSVGFYGMLKDCKVIKFETTTTRDALVNYLLMTLNGKLGDGYQSAQGRIMIVDD